MFTKLHLEGFFYSALDSFLFNYIYSGMTILSNLINVFYTILPSHCCLKDYGQKLSKILVLKRILLIVYLVTIIVCMLCYWRHVTHCEPGVYSAFAILEYVVVILNISLHATAALDFRDDVLSFQFHKLCKNEK